MPTFVALLRGINVGKAKRVPMAELRSLFEELGYGGGIQTLLNSGNVVFAHAQISAAVHAKAISVALRARFGFDVPVVVKSAGELAAIVEQNPLAAPGVDPSRLLVVFAPGAAPPAALRALTAAAQLPEQFAVGERAAYLYCPDGILASPAAGRALAGLGERVTTRNWATTLKLLALVATSGASGRELC
jgi:uncharacterized protein (DUF1697 family)